MAQTLGRLGSKKPNSINLNESVSNSSADICGHRSSLPEIALSPREKQILSDTPFENQDINLKANCAQHLIHSQSSDNFIDSDV